MNKRKNWVTYWQLSVHVVLASALYISSTMPLLAVMPLTVKVVIQQGTCDVSSQGNTNQPIAVDFENIVAERVNGIAYEKPIPYQLTCSNSGSNPALWMTLSGTGATFNGQLLATSDPQLGLRLRVNGQAFTPGQRINFPYQLKPSLSAIPVIGTLSRLRGGGFTATATLSVNYQ